MLVRKPFVSGIRHFDVPCHWRSEPEHQPRHRVGRQDADDHAHRRAKHGHGVGLPPPAERLQQQRKRHHCQCHVRLVRSGHGPGGVDSVEEGEVDDVWRRPRFGREQRRVGTKEMVHDGHDVVGEMLGRAALNVLDEVGSGMVEVAVADDRHVEAGHVEVPLKLDEIGTVVSEAEAVHSL